MGLSLLFYTASGGKIHADVCGAGRVELRSNMAARDIATGLQRRSAEIWGQKALSIRWMTNTCEHACVVWLK